jgi:hypothetical protein
MPERDRSVRPGSNDRIALLSGGSQIRNTLLKRWVACPCRGSGGGEYLIGRSREGEATSREKRVAPKNN